MKSSKEDFLNNKEFVRWVKQPNDNLDKYWKKWLETHPDQRNDFFIAREVIKGLQTGRHLPTPEEKEEILLKILSGDTNQITADNKKGRSHDLSFYWKSFPIGGKVAALLLLAFMCIISLKALNQSSEPQPEIQPVMMLTKSTTKGQKCKFKLPDGSMVWLNADSKLIYPEQFPDSLRQVSLIGEAFFEVAKNPAKPFKVITEDLTTTALGTAFNINTFCPQKLDVSLIEGKVKVENARTEEKILLSPGQQLQYSLKEQKTTVGVFDGLTVTGWKEGILYLKDSKFEDVIEKLKRWYGVDIEVLGKPKPSWSLTGKYDNQSLEMVLNRMSYIEHFEYTIQDKNVTLKF